MCFANAVLQILVYCPPFHKLFAELGRLLGENGGQALGLGAGDKDREGTPLVDATIVFLKEFTSSTSRGRGEAKDGPHSRGGSVLPNGRGKGKGREKLDDDRGTGDDDWDGESFLPTYIYDAMKEKKRFDSMRVSCYTSYWVTNRAFVLVGVLFAAITRSHIFFLPGRPTGRR
jgi:ubiquitin carboxyl-terminal hydrolase 10